MRGSPLFAPQKRREMASTSQLAPNALNRNCAFFASCRASIIFTPTGYKITLWLGLLAPDTGKLAVKPNPTMA